MIMKSRQDELSSQAAFTGPPAVLAHADKYFSVCHVTSGKSHLGRNSQMTEISCCS